MNPINAAQQLAINLQAITEAETARAQSKKTFDRLAIDTVAPSHDVMGGDGTVLPLSDDELALVIPMVYMNEDDPHLNLDNPNVSWFFSPNLQTAGIRVCNSDGAEQAIYLLPPVIVQLLTKLRTEVQNDTALKISNAVTASAAEIIKGE